MTDGPKLAKWDLSLRASGWTDQAAQILGYAGLHVTMSNFEKVDLNELEKCLISRNEILWLLEANSKPKLSTFVQLYNEDTHKDILLAKLSKTQRSVLVK